MTSLFTIAVAKATDGLAVSTDKLNGGDASVAVGEFLNQIVDILLILAIPLAILSVIYAAFALIRAQGKPEGYAKAKSYITYVVIGIFFIVFAGILVRAVYSLFAKV